jgi:hypothetical protein
LKENLHVAIDASEHSVRELAKRTHRYYLTNVVNKIIARYIKCFRELADHMYTQYRTCLILEESESFDDVIDGV